MTSSSSYNPTDPHESLSIWKSGFQMPPGAPLTGHLKVDVCIVGGGIAGLSTAYQLTRAGKRVCVLESHEIGSGQTGQTTAQFSVALENRYFELERLHGNLGARLVAQSHKAAIHEVQKIVAMEKIDCAMEKVNGYLFTGRGQSREVLTRELEATHRAGLLEVYLEDSVPISYLASEAALVFPQQLQLHPLRYLKGLLEAATREGALVFTGTHVAEIHGGERAYVLTRQGHKVWADSIVVATNAPVNNTVSLHTKQAPYRTYVVGFRVPKGRIPHGMFWDTEDPYHFVRAFGLDETQDLLMVGGEDHKTGQSVHPEETFGVLAAWTQGYFPDCNELAFKWSGQVLKSVDGLAYLGHNPMDAKNVYVITGDTGNGMTHSTIGSMIIRDQILGRANRWEDLYRPSRINLKSLNIFFRENANVAAQYADWLKLGGEERVEDLPAGEGMVVSQAMKKVALYRSESGFLRACSAACPHLGGVVRWNTVEKSWDCPCHGSRFDCHGKVIEGPANQDLGPAEFHQPTRLPNQNQRDFRSDILLNPDL